MNSKQKKILKYYEDIALSNHDILKLVENRANIVLYPDLIKYSTIDEVLGPHSACFLLFEAKPRYGHWCLVFKTNKNSIEFFNPYGGYPDDSLEYIPEHYRLVSNQYYPYLSLLLYDSPYQLYYNEYQFQRHNKNTKTCGRWCVLRLLCRDMELEEFHKMIIEFTKKFDISNDELVTLATMYIN